MIPRSVRFLVSTVLCVLPAAVLDAGGWVVITVKDMPDYALVGKPMTLTYAVRQHGETLLGGLDGRIEARAGHLVAQARATAASEAGHYSATLTLPRAGSWTLDIVSGFGGPIGTSRVTLQAIDLAVPAPAASDAERGRRLFAAKGCATCHTHAAVGASSVSVGPDLTVRSYKSDYLKRFLADPRRPDTIAPPRLQMPDLQLRDAEITSLVAFINADRLDSLTRRGDEH